MQIQIPYGKRNIDLQLDHRLAKVDIFKPAFNKCLDEPEKIFKNAIQSPIGSPPLRNLISSNDKVVVITSDGTRPVPNKFLIPLILEEINLPDDKITILIGNGTHRANSVKEITSMFGSDIIKRIKILNHDCYDDQNCILLGSSKTNGDIYLNRFYVEADKRIVLGFIEPHFFAGFSGGPKGIIPAIAGLKTILRVHRSELISDPRSTWGELTENPIQREIREMVKICPPDFLINVTLGSCKNITGFFCGNYLEAHYQGCRVVRELCTLKFKKKYPLVITSNGGYPLDQNLYQTVKSMSAAACMIEKGGTIVCISECRDGIPSDGHFAKIISNFSIEEIMDRINPEENMIDGWQVQIFGQILKNANLALFSSMEPDQVRKCHIEPIVNLNSYISNFIKSRGVLTDVAVLPEGTQSIPSFVMQ